MSECKHSDQTDDPWNLEGLKPPRRRPVRHPSYYFVQALKDGTICFVCEARKPYTRRGTERKFIDEDGCFGSWECDASYPGKEPDANRIILMTAIANKLNTKKALREMVDKRLDRIEQQLAAITRLLEQRT